MSAKLPSVAAPPSSKSSFTPTYVPASLAARAASSNKGISRLNAIRARKTAPAPVPSVAAATAVPKIDMTGEFTKLIQKCDTSSEELLTTLESVENPLYVIDDTATEVYTPLSFAIRCNKLDVADKIIEKIIAQPKLSIYKIGGSALFTPLLEAIRKADIGAIELLAAKFYSQLSVTHLYSLPIITTFIYNTIFSTALHLTEKSLDVIKALISSKYLPYYNSPYTLHYAIKNGNVGAVKLIIDEASNKNIINIGVNGVAPLDLALDKKNIEIMKILLENGAIVTRYVRNSLTDLNTRLSQSNETVALLQPYLVEQSEIPINVPISVATTDKTVPRSELKFIIEEEDGIPILTIPQGSLLYNSFYVDVLKNAETGEMNLDTVLRTFGGLMPFATNVTKTDTGLKITSCIDRFSQKFFYTNPAGGTALVKVVGDYNFNITATFQTKRDMRFALLMTPSPFHRLEGINSKPHPAIYPCSETNPEDCECAPLKEEDDSYRFDRGHKCKFGFHYDVCIEPEFLKDHALDGHIAIAGGDSYETRLKGLQEKFNDMDVDTKYKDLTNLIFNACMSVDKRVDVDVDKRVDAPIRGFPELVVQIFGTDWYDTYKSQQFEYEIPLGTNERSDEAMVRALVRFLLDFNSRMEPTDSIPVQSPLQLIRISTEYHWYNFETGSSRDNSSLAPLTVQNKYYRYFMANLEAYFNGDLRFIVDPRTGFLVRPGYLPMVDIIDGAPISYEALCFGTATGSSELAISANARIEGLSGWNNVWMSSPVDMLEYAPSDIPSNINIKGGTRFRTRRRPKSMKRQVRGGPAKSKTIRRLPTRIHTSKSINHLSTNNSMKVSNRKENEELDRVYEIFMEEIRKQLKNKATSGGYKKKNYLRKTRKNGRNFRR
jgi:ankyrin repeat protein